MLNLHKILRRAIERFVAESAALSQEVDDLIAKVGEVVKIREQQVRAVAAMVVRLKALRYDAERLRDEAIEEVVNGSMPVIVLDDEEKDDDKKN
jgi:pyrroline-5-carboxylate reductase